MTKARTSGRGVARRRGASLAELLVIMWAASMVLTMSAVLMHRIMHASTRALRLADVERTSLRLANMFRGDVHAASEANTNSSDAGEVAIVQLTLPEGRRIEYRREGESLVRLLLDPGGKNGREVFELPAGASISVEQEAGRLVTLIVRSRLPETASEEGGFASAQHFIPVHLCVTAALDRDGRGGSSPSAVGGGQ